jgi:hypothetical protein
MRKVAEMSISLRGLAAIARLLVPWAIGLTNVSRRLEVVRELIVGVIVDTVVLALGIFIFITMACVALP